MGDRRGCAYSSSPLYAADVKRFQILLDDELDEALEIEARRRGTSKAAILRELARRSLVALPPLASDPIARMSGRDSFDQADIDEVVYG